MVDVTGMTAAKIQELIGDMIVSGYVDSSSGQLILTSNNGLSVPAGVVAFVYPQWVSFVPNFSGLTIGNGSIVARRQRLGSTVHATVKITFGNSTVFNGSDFRFYLPFSPEVAAYISGRITLPSGSGPLSRALWAHGNLDASTSTIKMSSDNTVLNGTNPWASYPSGTVIEFHTTYEIAAIAL